MDRDASEKHAVRVLGRGIRSGCKSFAEVLILSRLVRQEVTIVRPRRLSRSSTATIMWIKQVAKDCRLATLAASKPGAAGRQRDYELEAAKAVGRATFRRVQGARREADCWSRGPTCRPLSATSPAEEGVTTMRGTRRKCDTSCASETGGDAGRSHARTPRPRALQECRRELQRVPAHRGATTRWR